MNHAISWTGAPVAALVLTLSGCAVAPAQHTPAVRSAITDPDAFVTALDTLAPSTATRLPTNESPVPFSRLEFTLRVTELNTSNLEAMMKSRPTLSVRKVFMPGAAPGTVRDYDIWSTNDIPFRYNFRVTYRNYVSLKWQYVYVNRGNAEPYSELKTLDHIDPIEGRTEPARASYSFGAQGQTSGFRAETLTCTFGSVKPAKNLHPDLVGDFTEMTCDYHGPNGQLVSQGKFAYLQKYGIALAMEHHDASVKTTFKIETVHVEGNPGTAPKSDGPT